MNWKNFVKMISLQRWLLSLLLALVVIGLGWASGVQAQSIDTPALTILGDEVKVRSGPDPSYPPFDTLPVDTTWGIIGYNAETGFWQIVSRFGSPGWVSGDSAAVSINEAAIQQFIAPTPVDNSQFTIHNSQFTISNSPNLLVFQTSSGGPIYAINADGANLRYLTDGMDPALSPDGQWVAFTRWTTSQDGALGSLWLINVDGSGERVLMTNVLNPRAPVWSPDGTQIALAMQQGGRVGYERVCSSRPPRGALDIDPKRDQDGDIEFCYTLLPDPHWKLRVVNVATGAHEDLPGDTYSLSPAWDPANPQHLLYDGDRGLVHLNLTGDTTTAFNTEVNDHSPIFSPDGQKIAVSYWQNDHWEVHVMNADTPTGTGGSGRLRLTGTSYITWAQQQLTGRPVSSYNNAAPAWSPDGSQIAFLTDRTGRWEIWLMNVDGSNQQPMFPAETLAGIPLEYNGVDEQVLSWR